MRQDGLTDEEGVIRDHLVAAFELFYVLDRTHPDEMLDFVDGLHKAQNQLALRVLRRDYPEGWPSAEGVAQ